MTVAEMYEIGTRTRASHKSTEKNAPVSAYQGLVYNIFQLRRDAHRGLAIAMTSPARRTGTSHLVTTLSQELGRHPDHRILRVDLTTLARTAESIDEVMHRIRPTANSTIFEIPGEASMPQLAPQAVDLWHASVQFRRECIDQLRAEFQYILFDCPALRESGDALGIAPLVDGLLLIIEADRTTKADIFQAERQIETAGGHLYGSILNKRKYLVPSWARRRLL